MRYSPLGLIKALLDTFLHAFDPYPKEKNVSNDDDESAWSLEEMGNAQAAAQDDLGKQYWQDLFNQHLDEKARENEQISEMMMEDYESKHTQAGNSQNQSNTQQDSFESEGSGQTDFSESCDFDSGDFNSGGGYDGYIG